MKPIRQMVLTATWTELKSSNAASFVMPAGLHELRAALADEGVAVGIGTRRGCPSRELDLKGALVRALNANRTKRLRL